LKGVVRKVLSEAGKDGLTGDHHFYISFRTEYPGVRLSNRLREKYPQEMTIVLQHQFWDLAVTEHTFEVGLSFSGVPERLLIPFDALTGFFDPSVQFGLKFESQDDGIAEDTGEPAAVPSHPARGAGSEPVELQPKKPAPVAKGPAPKLAVRPVSESEKAGKPAPEVETESATDDSSVAGAEVVSLDAFRKKS
jgi:uncharacterized protein